MLASCAAPTPETAPDFAATAMFVGRGIHPSSPLHMGREVSLAWVGQQAVSPPAAVSVGGDTTCAEAPSITRIPIHPSWVGCGLVRPALSDRNAQRRHVQRFGGIVAASHISADTAQGHVTSLTFDRPAASAVVNR